jgi:PAS domain S-box-containing protein
MAGRQLLALVHPGDREAVGLHWRQLASGQPASFECRCHTASGPLRWLQWRAAPAPDGRVHASGLDVTDRKRFEQELWRTHAETERLLASITSILVRVDEHGSVARWNPAAEAAFGVEAPCALGRPLDEVVAWTDSRLSDTLRGGFATPVRLPDLRYRPAAGSDRFVTLTATPLQRAPGEPDGVLLLGADVTEHRILEEQLRQAQKLEAIGQLAAGIAHEINTPTQYVGDNIRFLQDAFRDLDPLLAAIAALSDGSSTATGTDAACLEPLTAQARAADLPFVRQEVPLAIAQSLDGIQRVTRIVRAMKEFSHPSADKIAVDLNRAVETTLVVAQNEIKYVADTTVDLDPLLPPVPCVPGEINQVILNLLVNAAHAIADLVLTTPGGRGRITVATRHCEPWAELSVADSGGGIAEAILGRIFEPFFTTKEVGRGTGQGLVIAHAVVVGKHGGHLRVASTGPAGTTFVVRLPLHPVPPPADGGPTGA